MSRYLRILIGALRAGVLMSAIALLSATGGAWLASLHWTLDLLTHFRLQYAVLAAILLMLSLGLRSIPGFTAAGFVLIFNLAVVWPDLQTDRSTSAIEGPVLRILMTNVFTANQDVLALDEMIRREDPDVIGLLEVNNRWLRDLNYLRGEYPFALERPREDNFGLALFSKIPFVQGELVPLEAGGVDAAFAHIVLGDREIALLLAHPLPPAGRRYSEIRNLQLREFARIRKRTRDLEFILMGDLNTTPWSPYFRTLAKDAELEIASRGFGLAASWPTSLRFMMIPIDHVLLSPGLRARSYRVGPSIGSDHRPILAVIGFRSSPVEENEALDGRAIGESNGDKISSGT